MQGGQSSRDLALIQGPAHTISCCFSPCRPYKGCGVCTQFPVLLLKTRTQIHKRRGTEIVISSASLIAISIVVQFCVCVIDFSIIIFPISFCEIMMLSLKYWEPDHMLGFRCTSRRCYSCSAIMKNRCVLSSRRINDNVDMPCVCCQLQIFPPSGQLSALAFPPAGRVCVWFRYNGRTLR